MNVRNDASSTKSMSVLIMPSIIRSCFDCKKHSPLHIGFNSVAFPKVKVAKGAIDCLDWVIIMQILSFMNPIECKLLRHRYIQVKPFISAPKWLCPHSSHRYYSNSVCWRREYGTWRSRCRSSVSFVITVWFNAIKLVLRANPHVHFPSQSLTVVIEGRARFATSFLTPRAIFLPGHISMFPLLWYIFLWHERTSSIAFKQLEISRTFGEKVYENLMKGGC